MYFQNQKMQKYFPLPNEIFSLDLSAGEIAVYAYLMYCEDRKTFQCHPSYTTIGKVVKMSKNTVKKYVDGLVEKQLITTEPTEVTLKDGRRHNGSLLYTIRPIQEAVEHDYEQRLKRFQAEQYRQKVLERWEKRYGNQGSIKKQEKESAP